MKKIILATAFAALASFSVSVSGAQAAGSSCWAGYQYGDQYPSCWAAEAFEPSS